MMELRFQDGDASRIIAELVGRETERCAVLWASHVALPGLDRLVVSRIEFPTDDNYSDRSRISAQLKPDFIAQIGKKAARENLSAIFVHSHPGAAPPEFSEIDDDGETHLARFMSVRAPHTVHGAVVVSAGGWCARRLGEKTPMRVVSVGPRLQVLFDADGSSGSTPLKFDRQVRALGSAGQKYLESLTVAIVGLGGTGSIAAEQLAHLGVRKFILVDPDRIETTNLNRVVGARVSDVNRHKTDVAADMIAQITSDAECKRVVGDVTRTAVARELRAADFIFACTDSHGSRAVIQQIAYQYLIPCVDMGSIITARAGQIAGIVAPAHGDMHATNVLVRHGDAILIDFEKLEPHFPLTYDPASLEGGLLVEGFIEDLKKKRFTPKQLLNMISPLYEERALRTGHSTFCRPGDPTEWYFNAVNQIRTLSWPAERVPGQYALTLALCLIRKGCNSHPELNKREPNTLRAIAFFFGQKILRAMARATATPSRARQRRSGGGG